MKIVMLGTGYVGLVSGACFAEMGNTVTCMDTDTEKISKLKSGILPIYEPGLDQMITHNVTAQRLSFVHAPEDAIKSADIVFICVGTPSGEHGSADLRYVREAARIIGKSIETYTVVVTKSTVPVGTTDEVERIIREEVIQRKSDASFDMVNNPEFLKEGNAINDFMRPDRIVIGTRSSRAEKIMRRLYTPFLRTDIRIIDMTIESSELTKYASNTMLATRISFMNELALLAEKIGADIEEVRQGMARDRRIGKYFLFAGAGYGGSCFPKDVAALIKTGKAAGCEMNLVKAANEVNKKQKQVIAEKVLKFFNNDVHGKKIALWGLAFKPETDDVREAPAIEVIQTLVKAGATFAVHDPEALENAKIILGEDSLQYHTDCYRTLHNAVALIIMTEWKEYRTPDWKKIKTLVKEPVLFDGRNLYDPEEMKEFGFRYFGIGHGERL